jgi:RNA polymerase sigma-70 factor (ECF subfamily)
MEERAIKTMDELSDVMSNNTATVAELFNLHYRAIYLAAYRVSGNSQDAEDVLQTVFLRLLKRSELEKTAVAPDIGDNPASYLCRSAINASLDILRAKRRNPVVDLNERRHEADPALAAADKEAHRDEQGRHLRAALLQLHPRAAEIFVLRYFEEYGNAEIADLLDTSSSSIAVTLHRTRDRLRELLHDFEGESFGGTPHDR